MKLNFIEMCGFRGFQRKVRIDFAHGFTIITGRNGVGKSTICDAVEFALTGSIDKYSVEKAAKESLVDYLWWRGDTIPSTRYVTVSFVAENGERFDITRTPESRLEDKTAEIEAALCVGTQPERALQQLCKTSIIRDEWIAALSLDLTETERFELVRSALGQSDSSDHVSRAKETVAHAEATLQRLERDYEQNRSRLTAALTQLSETKEVAGRSADIEAAMNTLSRTVADLPDEITMRLSFVRNQLVLRRERLRKIEEEVERARKLEASQRSMDTSEFRARRERIEHDLAQAESARAQSRGQFAEAQRALGLMEAADGLAVSLAALVDHGGRVGLHEGHCPLCDALRSKAEFEQGLSSARRRAEELAAGVSEARRRLTAARAAVSQSDAAYQGAETAWRSSEREKADLVAATGAHALAIHRLELSNKLAVNPDGLQREHDIERDRLIEIERALLTLEASHAITRVAANEDRVSVLQRDSEAAATELAKGRTTVERARSIERAIKRISGEIIDERLAQISPLLNELYQRLRPHTDWRTIEYSIRGDVRRFLSLKVGNGLNPQFVFSSGQRRAAGLAFLLAVHLARNWTRWRTLILDDPIQHIDDFRALHLVEVLAALRRDGSQIVCAVEDDALADLLCRRLSSSSTQAGCKYTLEPGTENSIDLRLIQLPSLPNSVLRGGSGLKTAAM